MLDDNALGTDEFNDGKESSILSTENTQNKILDDHPKDVSFIPLNDIFDDSIDIENLQNEMLDDNALGNAKFNDGKESSILSTGNTQNEILDDYSNVVSFVPLNDIFDDSIDIKNLSPSFKPFRILNQKQRLETYMKKKKAGESICTLSKGAKFNCIFFAIPIAVSLCYSIAIIFPAGSQEKDSIFLWTHGLMTKTNDGQATICPRKSICAEGITQISLLILSRTTALVTYTLIGGTFLSKMHFFTTWLSSTFVREIVPIEKLHKIHKRVGLAYFTLSLIHFIGHFIRWSIREELVYYCGTKVGLSGLIGIFAMSIVVLSMCSITKRLVTFEKRINTHYLFIVLVGALCYHTHRCMVLTLLFFGLWSLDYLYGYIFKTHCLEIVEFSPLPDLAGVQMLWRNPSGFKVKSGMYVKIQLPWLSEGGSEWHPFSIYLREATLQGLQTVISMDNLQGLTSFSSESESEEAHQDTVEEFTRAVLAKRDENNMQTQFILDEAREDNSLKNETTQIFIIPSGDWTKRVAEEISGQDQMRSCWVRGPYASPYTVASNFNHLLLVASGIGITPALGVINQYPRHSRTKFLVWCTRSPEMLKFFAPLLTDVHVAIIYYTGKKYKFSKAELTTLQSFGNVRIEQKRPQKITAVIESLIMAYEGESHNQSLRLSFHGSFHRSFRSTGASTISQVEKQRLKAWCVLYCGGSQMIKNDISSYTKKIDVGFEYEKFDW